MRPTRVLLGGLLGVLLCLSSARAEKPASPLRFIPDQADLVAQIPDPQRLVETATTLDLVKHIQGLEAVKELLDSTRVRRFTQLLAHFEKELGVGPMEMLDRLAGGGTALATKFDDKGLALLVIQGKDEQLTRKFLKAALAVVEQELARQETRVKIDRTTYQGIDVLGVGDDLCAAEVQGALILANKKSGLRAALDLATGKSNRSMAQHTGIAETAKLLPKEPLASIWINMDPVKKNPGFEAIYKTPRDPFITVVFGCLADLLGRSPSITGALCHDDQGLLATVRIPRGKDGMGADRAVNTPPSGKPSSRPLLQPKGTLFSSSFYWDLSRFWTDRVALFGEERAKEFEKADKSSGSVLSTVQLSKMLTAAGPYHRLVTVHQPKGGYKKQPKNPLPAAAFVLELSKPEEFSKGIETVLRSAGLFVTAQIGLKMVEEKYNGCNILGYRFDEEKELKEDVDDARFNASPCFVRVGNQYVFCSTMELCRELIDLLQKESTAQDSGSAITSRSVFYSTGGKEILKTFHDQLVASAILGQALPLNEAKAQVKAFLDVFDKVEGLTLEETYAAKQFHLDIRLKIKK